MSKEKIYLRVNDGVLLPADSYAATVFKSRSYKNGDVLAAMLNKVRNPRFNRLAHKLADLVKHNIETFENYETHGCLKRLQLEANAACEEIKTLEDGKWKLNRYPKTFSFDSMDESEYQQAIKKICFYICENYWPSETPEQIERMAIEHARIY